MYFIVERQEEKELTEMPLDQRLKSLLLNMYILTFIVFDLAFIKKRAYEVGVYSLSGVYSLLSYFILAEGYGLYMYMTSKEKLRAEEISWAGTILWHAGSLFKTVLFGFALSSARHQYFSVYFMVRFTIYASTFFLILSHLRVVRKFVLKKDQLKTLSLRHTLWQLANFNKVFYGSLLGISIDVVAFGNDLNYYCWIAMMAIWGLYEFKIMMAANRRWKYLKHIFESE